MTEPKFLPTHGTWAPGKVFDKHGYPIYPGDLLRSFHFIGPRKRTKYLYHTAVYNQRWGCMELVPTQHLEPSTILSDPGGRCVLTENVAKHAEIISGMGPDNILDFRDRKKCKKTNA